VITSTFNNLPPNLVRLMCCHESSSLSHGVMVVIAATISWQGHAGPSLLLPLSMSNLGALPPPCARSAEIWDPATEMWTTVAPMSVPRTYHSVALLLTDGRVFVGGGGLCGLCSVNHKNGQIYTPPYLFDATGAPALQPMISVSIGTPTWGDSIDVSANTALGGISMIRYGSVTHSLNTDQRRIELCGPATSACVGGGTTGRVYTVTIPSDPGIALQGGWMVFGMDIAGVPSYSKRIQIGAVVGAATVAATATKVTPADPVIPLPPGLGLD
jgi:Domain of unknown function (DUF1929)